VKKFRNWLVDIVESR